MAGQEPLAAVRLVAGLGNPGAEYAQTRHNVGFRFLEALLRQYPCALRDEPRFVARAGKCVIAGTDVLVLAPNTYMNESGDPVARVARYHKVPPESILIVHDELDLPVGVARLKTGGGTGGHNGLASVERALGSNAFWRLRLGIGRPPEGRDVIGYVLGRTTATERAALDDAIARALTELPDILLGRTQHVMNRLHTGPGT
ncbi:MAG: aminoacyl-tRNA hydrolase [Acidiferrobacteraceae bacterium]